MKKLQSQSVLNFAEPVSQYGGIPEFILGFKTNGRPMTERPKVTTSKEGADIIRTFISPEMMEHKEYFYIICLSRNNQPLGVFQVSQRRPSRNGDRSKGYFSDCDINKRRGHYLRAQPPERKP